MMNTHFHALMLLLNPLKGYSLLLASGFWQEAMEENDKEKTAFSTSEGHSAVDLHCVKLEGSWLNEKGIS